MNPEPKNDGGPAFPHGPLGDSMQCEDGRIWHQHPAGTGMTLRDWFASQEQLCELDHPENLISETVAVALAGPKPTGSWSTNTMEFFKWEAKWRAALKYIRADAMLKAREE